MHLGPTTDQKYREDALAGHAASGGCAVCVCVCVCACGVYLLIFWRIGGYSLFCDQGFMLANKRISSWFTGEKATTNIISTAAQQRVSIECWPTCATRSNIMSDNREKKKEFGLFRYLKEQLKDWKKAVTEMFLSIVAIFTSVGLVS